jgi:predicted nucleic acid-binding protein
MDLGDEKSATLAEVLFRRHRHQGLEIPDALVAATALTRKLTLVTFNQKHFRFLKNLDLFPIDRLTPG